MGSGKLPRGRLGVWVRFEGVYSACDLESDLSFCKSLSSDIDQEKLMEEVKALANSGNLEVVKAFNALGCELSDKTKPQKQAGYMVA